MSNRLQRINDLNCDELLRCEAVYRFGGRMHCLIEHDVEYVTLQTILM